MKLKSHLAWEVAVGCQCTLPCPLWLWPGWPWPHPSHWQHGHPDASEPSASPKLEVHLVKIPIPASEKLIFSPHWACCYSGSSSAGPPASPSSHSTPWSSTWKNAFLRNWFQIKPLLLHQSAFLNVELFLSLGINFFGFFIGFLKIIYLTESIAPAYLQKDEWS